MLQLVLQVVGGELVTVTRGAVERKAGTGCQLELTDHLRSEGAGGGWSTTAREVVTEVANLIQELLQGVGWRGRDALCPISALYSHNLQEEEEGRVNHRLAFPADRATRAHHCHGSLAAFTHHRLRTQCE